MNRLAPVLLASLPTTCVAVESLAAEDQRPLDFRTISLNGDKGGMVAVIDGHPRLVNSRTAWTEWTLRETDKGWTIQCRLSREKPELRFLGVDAEGKITLAAELGDGAYWKLTRKGDRQNSFDATLQAAGGKFDGWYLDFSDKPEQIEQGRFKYDSYRVKLSEKPDPRTNLHIFLDGQVPEYMLLSDEIGTWAGDIAKAKLPDQFVVDYVRVYDLVEKR